MSCRSWVRADARRERSAMRVRLLVSNLRVSLPGSGAPTRGQAARGSPPAELVSPGDVSALLSPQATSGESAGPAGSASTTGGSSPANESHGAAVDPRDLADRVYRLL